MRQNTGTAHLTTATTEDSFGWLPERVRAEGGAVKDLDL